MWRVKLAKRGLGGVVLLSTGLCLHRTHRAWAEPRDVLVIGGTGLMGCPTVQLLQSQGHRVVVLSRGRERGQGTSGARPRAPQCDMVQCDRSEDGALTRELLKETCPRIVVDYTAMRPGDIEQVLAAHRQKPLQHYIFISTNMVYPGGPENFDVSDVSGQVLTEDRADLANAHSAPDTYGGRKLKCESLLATSQLPFTTLRPPAVVGPGCDRRHERLQRLVQQLPALPPGPARPAAAAHGGRFRVVYSGDVAAAVAAVVRKGAEVHGEAFNVGGESMTMEEYVREMSDILKVEMPQLPEPSEDATVWNYEKQGEVDITKAVKLLNFKPTPLRDWLIETVMWHTPLLETSVADKSCAWDCLGALLASQPMNQPVQLPIDSLLEGLPPVTPSQLYQMPPDTFSHSDQTMATYRPPVNGGHDATHNA